jgi:hypothetical protein
MFSGSRVGGMRVASHLQGNTWGLVISRVGGKGAYQVGAMKAILEVGVKAGSLRGSKCGCV